jgi:hypothetical protein
MSRIYGTPVIYDSICNRATSGTLLTMQLPPVSCGGNRLSRSLIRFKEVLAFDLQAWIDCSLNELQQIDMPGDVILMREQNNNETTIDDIVMI